MAMPRLAGGTTSITLPSMRTWPDVCSSSPAMMRQQGRLAAARRADEDDELAIGDLEVDALDDLDLAPKDFLTFSRTRDPTAFAPTDRWRGARASSGRRRARPRAIADGVVHVPRQVDVLGDRLQIRKSCSRSQSA